MHAMLITFQSAVGIEDLAEPFSEYAQGLRDVDGLVLKTWIKNDETLGGFHVFSSRADADRYLASQMVAGLTGNPAFTNFAIERFDVIGDLSRVTGTPTTPLVTAA
jgi:hypothetical protein